MYPSWDVLNNFAPNQQFKKLGLADPGLTQNQHLHQNSAHLDHFEKRFFNFCEIVNLVYPSWDGKTLILLRKIITTCVNMTRIIFKTKLLSFGNIFQSKPQWYIIKHTQKRSPRKQIAYFRKCTLVGTFPIIFPKIKNSKIWAGQVLDNPKMNVLAKNHPICTISRRDHPIFVKIVPTRCTLVGTMI